jgi:Spy/CpxP family protein refolding chaperone
MNITKPMKTIVSISAVCAVLAFSSISIADVSSDNVETDAPKHHQNKHHKKNHQMMKKMAKYLGLSDEQKSQIKAIKTQDREQQTPLRVELKQFKEAEKLLVNAEKLDESAYIALHASYQQTFAQVELARAKTKNALFNVLTTEQQAKWLSKMEKHKGKKKGKNKGKNKRVNKD